MTRYVVIRDDAPIEAIDEALAALCDKRAHAGLEVTRGWISEDIEELLEMRSARMADV